MTKCISEVPGLAKQTSTPALANVMTKLAAPFIRSSPMLPSISAPTNLGLDETVVSLGMGCYRRYLPTQSVLPVRTVLQAAGRIAPTVQV